jgi:hypothetical protein
MDVTQLTPKSHTHATKCHHPYRSAMSSPTNSVRFADRSVGILGRKSGVQLVFDHRKPVTLRITLEQALFEAVEIASVLALVLDSASHSQQRSASPELEAPRKYLASRLANAHHNQPSVVGFSLLA